jgi:hypothetical protein
MVWRSGRYQVFLIFDGVLTAGLAVAVGLIVATFIHKDWTISGGWWDVFGVILLVRFADDAGLHGEIDTSLHLERPAKRDWWRSSAPPQVLSCSRGGLVTASRG